MKPKPVKVRKKIKSKAPIYEKEILEIIKSKALSKISQIFSFYSGIRSAQFYNLGLEKSETLLKALQDNRTKMCQSLLVKWYHGDNPTLQMAAYKILCDDEERKKLSMVYSDVEVNDKRRKTTSDLFPTENELMDESKKTDK